MSTSRISRGNSKTRREGTNTDSITNVALVGDGAVGDASNGLPVIESSPTKGAIAASTTQDEGNGTAELDVGVKATPDKSTRLAPGPPVIQGGLFTRDQENAKRDGLSVSWVFNQDLGYYQFVRSRDPLTFQPESYSAILETGQYVVYRNCRPWQAQLEAELGVIQKWVRFQEFSEGEVYALLVMYSIHLLLS